MPDAPEKMFAEERHSLIKKIVREHQRMNFLELQKLVEVSPATLRRDLAELEQSGDLIRVHGGILHPDYVRSEISFDERLHRESAAKKRIAAHAASLIPAGASVYLDAGSTCLEAGKILLRRKDLRIVTHSVVLLTEALHGEASVLAVGGELRQVSGALTGGRALDALARIRTDFAFIGASGLNPDGLWTTELSEADLKQSILTLAGKTYLLADASKWPTTSVVRFADWPQITDWITNRPFSEEEPSPLPPGVKLHLAPP